VPARERRRAWEGRYLAAAVCPCLTHHQHPPAQGAGRHPDPVDARHAIASPLVPDKPSRIDANPEDLRLVYRWLGRLLPRPAGSTRASRILVGGHAT
jgi:hypothetical protein